MTNLRERRIVFPTKEPERKILFNIFREMDINISDSCVEEDAAAFYPLITFKKENGKPPRSDEAYGKQYLEGRYGADPYLRKILNREEINESETIESE